MSFYNTIRRLKFEQGSIDHQICVLQEQLPKAINSQESQVTTNTIEALYDDRKKIDDAITILDDWSIIRDCFQKTSKYADIQPTKKR